MVNGANQFVVLEHWHDEKRPDAGQLRRGDDHRIALDVRLIRQKSATWTTCFVCDDAAERASGLKWITALRCRNSTYAGGAPMHRDGTNASSFDAETDSEFGLADAHRVLQHGLEHRLQLAGRTVK